MTKTMTWIGKAAVLAVCLAVVAALVLAAISDDAEAKKKRKHHSNGGGIAGFALNADKLDGKDSSAFFSGETYAKDGNAVQGVATQINTASAGCDAGDTPLSGGHRVNSGDPSFVFFEKTDGDSHDVQFTSSLNVTSNVTCADFPPLRSQANSQESDPNQENAEPSDPKQESNEQSNTDQ